jgi:hypothetical protein
MARTFQANRFYPAPGNSSKADGFSVDLAGNAEFQEKLLKMGPLVVARALRVMEVLGRELAMKANAAAPRGPKRHGRAAGGLAKSFKVYPRPQWQQLGKVGVAVRSSAKYHHFQEFGANKPNTQVVNHWDASGSKTVRAKKGQGEGKRYRLGTGRLNPGVFVKTYKRDIIIQARPFFGMIIRQNKDKMLADATAGLLNYIDRISKGDASDLGSERAD